MKIKITTDRNPWANDRKLSEGETVDVTADIGKALIDNGFAVEVKKPAPKKVSKEEE